MQEEIKNILKCLEMDMLDNKQIEKLLDYITNLQEENERLKIEYRRLADEDAWEIADYKSRNEKAIEIIEKYGKEKQLEEDYLMNRVNLANYNCLLLDILQGVDKE